MIMILATFGVQYSLYCVYGSRIRITALYIWRAVVSMGKAVGLGHYIYVTVYTNYIILYMILVPTSYMLLRYKLRTLYVELEVQTVYRIYIGTYTAVPWYSMCMNNIAEMRWEL